MAEKFLEHDGAGNKRENEALVVSTGAADAGKIIGLDSNGLIDPSMLTGIDYNIDGGRANEIFTVLTVDGGGA